MGRGFHAVVACRGSRWLSTQFHLYVVQAVHISIEPAHLLHDVIVEAGRNRQILPLDMHLDSTRPPASMFHASPPRKMPSSPAGYGRRASGSRRFTVSPYLESTNLDPRGQGDFGRRPMGEFGRRLLAVVRRQDRAMLASVGRADHAVQLQLVHQSCCTRIADPELAL